MAAGRVPRRRLSGPLLFVLGPAALGFLISAAVFAVTIDDVVEHNGLTRQDLGFGKDT